jgi:hypothetical protein
MSYDLMVFEPTAAPRDRDAFRLWYARQMQWEESHGYTDPTVCSPALQRWFDAISREFPNLNGPDVRDDEIDNRHTDYSFGNHVIYAGFCWSEAENAYPVVRRLAVEHEVGFYDASGDEGDCEIMFPGDPLRPPSQGAWRRLAAEFRSLSNG